MEKVDLFIYNPEGKPRVLRKSVVPRAGYVCRTQIGSEGCAYIVPEELYKQGVRSFLFVKGWSNPIEVVDPPPGFHLFTQEETRALLDATIMESLLGEANRLSWGYVSSLWSDFLKGLFGTIATKLRSITSRRRKKGEIPAH